MSLLYNIFFKISRYKIDEKTEEDSFAITTNITAIIVILLNIFYGLIGYFTFDSLVVLGIYMLYVIAYIFVIYLNSIKLYTTAKYITVIMAYFNVLSGSLIYGAKSGAEWYFYLGAILPFIIFSLKKTKDLLISVFLVVPFYILNQYLYNFIEPFEIEENILIMLYYSVFFSLLASIVGVIYIMRKTFIKFKNQIEKSKKELAKLNKNIQDNINYALLIQSAILPHEDIIDKFFDDNFIFWRPKDTIGGDIYFIKELNDDEILVMVIDGAGHGVSGAFVTMLVKAIENQIIELIHSKNLKPNPAEIMRYFNKNLKIMLRQFDKNSKSNVGFDGGILYYNKKTQDIIFSGAKTDLYLIDDNSNLEIIKGDRKSVGFKRAKLEQKYTAHAIRAKKGLKLYLSTDGIFDQEGALDQFYGKKRFEKFLLKNNRLDMPTQKSLLVDSINTYKAQNEQNDDITAIGLKI